MAASLTPLLIRLRDAGLSLRVEDGYVVAKPKDRIMPEIRAELRQHKAELLEALVWDEERAYSLLRESQAYLHESYLGAGGPNFSVEGLDSSLFRAHLRCLRRAGYALASDRRSGVG